MAELNCATGIAGPGGGSHGGSGSEMADAAASTDSHTVYALITRQAPESSGGGLWLLAGLGDGSVQLWALGGGTDATPTAWACEQRLRLHTDAVLCMAVAADGHLYCGSADCAISQVQLSEPLGGARAAGEPNSAPMTVGGGTGVGPGHGVGPLALLGLTEAAHLAEVHSVAPYASSRLLSASADGNIRMWGLPGMAPLHTLRARGWLGEPLAHEGAVYALLVVPPSTADQREPPDRSPPRLFSAAADRLIKAWDLNTTDQLATLSGHQSFVCALQASRGLLYSASCDQTLAVWRLSTYERLRVFSGHRGGLYSLTIDAHGRACSGSLDATVKVWPQVDTTASPVPAI